MECFPARSQRRSRGDVQQRPVSAVSRSGSARPHAQYTSSVFTGLWRLHVS